MAGTILISNGVGAAMSSVSFDFTIEKIRQQFSASEFEIVRSIFRPFDDEGMMFISLENATSEEFQAFCHAVIQARSSIEKEGHHWSSNAWSELFEFLSHDPRFIA